MKSRSGINALAIVIAIAAVGGLAWLGLARGGFLRSAEEAPIEGTFVKRGPLRISVIERGNLKAADSVSLKSEIEGQTTILYLIPEGTLVKEGDLVAELDATPLIDRRFQQEISVRNAEAAYVKSKQNYEIQKSQNDSDVKKAEQNLYFAETDLNKFKEGERQAKADQAKEKIQLAEEEHARANEKLGWSQKLSDKGFLTATELEADRLSLSRAQIQLEQAKRDRDLLTRFQLPRDESELTASLDESKRELERVKLQAAARIVDYDADMRTNEAKLALESEKLSKLQNQIAKAKLLAPRAGMAVYAQEEGGRYGMSQPMKEGAQVRERQELVTIPNAGGMIAQVSLHESILKQVQIGQTCLIKVDALAPREFHGRVSYVAVLPDQNSWFANPNARLYRTDVQISDGHPDMRPGMSCQIEILVEDITDTLYVPVQSVFRNGGQNVAFVRKAGTTLEREVKVGRYNDRWVQVLEGLSEGEVVLLAPPHGFAPEAAPESSPEGKPIEGAPQPGLPASGPAANAPGTAPTADAGAEAPAQANGEAERGEAGLPNLGSGDRPQITEEMRKRFEAMTPEQKAELRNRMGGGGDRSSGRRSGGGQSGGGENGGGRGASESKSDG